jgi:hypothetical protein
MLMLPSMLLGVLWKSKLHKMVELMVQNWNQLLPKFIFLHKHLQGNL